MNPSSTTDACTPDRSAWWVNLLLVAALLAGSAALGWFWANRSAHQLVDKVGDNASADEDRTGDPNLLAAASRAERPTTTMQGKSYPLFDGKSRSLTVRLLGTGQSRMRYWWDEPPRDIRQASLPRPAGSNLAPADYLGASRCQQCHRQIHQAWHGGRHQQTERAPEDAAVRSLFDPPVSFDYLGGRVTIGRVAGQPRMTLARDGQTLAYQVRRAIGAGSLQYFVGALVLPDSPEAATSEAAPEAGDVVLPLAYDRQSQRWGPAEDLAETPLDRVHDPQMPDPVDPFTHAATVRYGASCAGCHTTLPVGEWMLRESGSRIAEQIAPRPADFWFSAYLTETRPSLVHPRLSFRQYARSDVQAVLDTVRAEPMAGLRVADAVDCEACHLGARQHAEQSTPERSTFSPRYFPCGPVFFVQSENSLDNLAAAETQAWGRTATNITWNCARCHSRPRPVFAAEAAVMHSAEALDALASPCYGGGQGLNAGVEHLSCTHCHDPHQPATAETATRLSADARCLTCHQQYASAEAQQAHTHHPLDSVGGRCASCHLPQLTQTTLGIGRTHRIFSPTEPRMLEQAEPNACNLCHLDKSIGWTLDQLARWYPNDLRPAADDERLARHYPDTSIPVGQVWLASPNPHTRRVAAAAVARQRERALLPGLLDLLDDPTLAGRRIAERSVAALLSRKPAEFGYHYEQTAQQRRGPMKQLRAAAAGDSSE